MHEIPVSCFFAPLDVWQHPGRMATSWAYGFAYALTICPPLAQECSLALCVGVPVPRHFICQRHKHPMPRAGRHACASVAVFSSHCPKGSLRHSWAVNVECMVSV